MIRSKHWLNDQLGDYSSAEGVFKLRATLNWAAAIRCEIEARHGVSPENQLDSCRQHFRSQQFKEGPTERIGDVYCALFHALTSASTLISLNHNGAGRQWMYPSSVVTWYYAHYHAFRSIVFAARQDPGETHAKLQKTLNSLQRKRMPYPYNMRATIEDDDSLEVRFPDVPDARPKHTSTSFDETSEMAQTILLKYLESTVGWVKEDKRIQRNTFNFMDCAIRYRGNANYRDSLQLSYGTRIQKHYEEYLHNLAVSSRFATICGLAFAERAYSPETTNNFLEDLERNFRGLDSGTEEELFWRAFAA